MGAGNQCMFFKLARKMIKFKMLVLLHIFCSSALAVTPESAIKVVHEFVKGEFELDQNSRALYCAYDVDGVFILGSEFTPASIDPAVYFFFDSDEIAVVKNYHFSIGALAAEGAEVVVSYDLLFSASGVPRRIIKTLRSEDVTYKVAMINNELKIIDPPIPRVSYDHLISFYSDQIQRLKIIVDSKKASDAQIKSLQKLKADYDALQDLTYD